MPLMSSQRDLTMGTEAHRQQRTLQIFFLPLMSPGHMIPMVDMAKLFAARPGVSATIITTPGNEPLVRPSIESSPDIDLILVPFPSSVAHLIPNGKENLSSMTFSDFAGFFKAFYALQTPIEELLHARRPDCIVSDYMFTWTADTAIALNVPRIGFSAQGIFSACVHDSLRVHAPYKKVSDDSEVFVVEGLPHRIALTRAEVSLGVVYTPTEMVESLAKSHSVVVNSFYELEPEYAELYRRNGTRAYYVGPVSLSNREKAADRGQKLKPTRVQELMTWLDSMRNGSVMYVCFGSLTEFPAEQLREIAVGLELSGSAFLWAVRDAESEAGPDWLPEGFAERVEGRGLVMGGWVPQVVILNHPAVGGFLTHCGWNSTLEGVTAGVPMVAWPVEHEQFVNQRLITQVLEIGVSVGRGELTKGDGLRIAKAEQIAEAVKDVMGDAKEAEERRARARKYAAMAEAAMEVGGSSYADMTRLIEDIREHSLGSAN